MFVSQDSQIQHCRPVAPAPSFPNFIKSRNIQGSLYIVPTYYHTDERFRWTVTHNVLHAYADFVVIVSVLVTNCQEAHIMKKTKGPKKI